MKTVLSVLLLAVMLSSPAVGQEKESVAEQGKVESPGRIATLKASDKPADEKAAKAKAGKAKAAKAKPGKEKAATHPPSIWMQQKLKHAQRIFAGMVEGDFVAVEEAATHLKFINRLEGFVRGKSKGYRTQLRLFQFANEEILKAADEENLDRLTLGYNQMTLSCVACHKQLRQK